MPFTGSGFTNTGAPSIGSNGGGGLLNSVLGFFGVGGNNNISSKDFSDMLMKSWQNNPNSPYYTGNGGEGASTNQTDILTSLLKSLGITLPGITLPGLGGLGSGASNSTPRTGGSGSPNDAIAALLAALAGVSGGLNNRPGTTSTVPTFDPALAPLRQQTIDAYSNLLKDPNLTGYEASSESNINSQANIAKQNAIETAASRGIAGPSVDTSLNSIEGNRGSQIVNLKNSIPLLAQQLTLSNANAAGGFVNANRGSNITSPGNIAGGAVSGVSGLLAYLYGLGKL